LREHAFIGSQQQMVDLIVDRISKIRVGCGDLSMKVAFTVGVDATCLVPAWQVDDSHDVIVGGEAPSHFLQMKDKCAVELKEILQEYKDGKYGDPATEG